MSTPVRLTEFSHGGGCGCKIAPAVLQQLLANVPAGLQPPANLLVGREHSDDAAVWRLNDKQAVVATTDFFTPIVDDAHDFGRIAATNALSDLYAMGAEPLFALALVGMPLARIPLAVISRILAGGNQACADAGIVIAGGHSIDIPEPVYGLVAIGLVDPAHCKTNAAARAGDVLILSKPLGIGVYSAALRQNHLNSDDYADMLHWSTALNRAGPALAKLDGVHAITDVTGFGLGGHLLEICRAAKLSAQLQYNALPWLPRAVEFARNGIHTGASARNLASYGDALQTKNLAPWQQTLISDPQTSGGLLIACTPDAVASVCAELRAHQNADNPFTPVPIGQLQSGSAQIRFADTAASA